MTPKIATLASLLCMGTNMLAQESVMGRNLWIDQQTNEQQNIRFHSANPTRQAFNVQRNTAYAQADYTLLRGSFHAADPLATNASVSRMTGVRCSRAIFAAA